MKIEKAPLSLWMGDETSQSLAADALRQIASLTAGEMAELRTAMGEDGNEFDGYDYMVTRHKGVAIVGISGPMVNSDSVFNRMFGLVSYSEIRNAITAAVNNDEVNEILLDIDSGGGSAAGAFETSEFVRMVNKDHKPVTAHTSGGMLSAAMLIGSAAGTVKATEMSVVGSIGVIAVHREFTKAMEDAGVSVRVFRAGKFKALGGPYEKLTEQAVEEIQTKMERMYSKFTEMVAENTGHSVEFVRTNMAEGREFFGKDALEVGLVNQVATFDEVVSQLLSRHNAQRPYGLESTGDDMSVKNKKKTITEKAQASIAAGIPVDEALELSGGEVEEAAEVQAATDLAEEEGTKAEAKAPAADPSSSDNKVGDSGVVGALTDKISALSDQLVDAKMELRTATAQLETLKSAVGGLKEIAVSATQRMQIAMGQPAADLAHLESSALVSEHARINEAFTSRFKVGATAHVNTEEKQRQVPDKSAAQASRIKANK